MSSHHDDHHSAEVKPVSFSVPFILASVTLLIIFLFLSLCDPKHGHAAEGEAHSHGMEAGHHEAAAASEEHHHEAAAEAVAADSVTTPPPVAPELEGKPAEGEAHH